MPSWLNYYMDWKYKIKLFLNFTYVFTGLSVKISANWIPILLNEVLFSSVSLQSCFQFTKSIGRFIYKPLVRLNFTMYSTWNLVKSITIMESIILFCCITKCIAHIYKIN